MAGSDDEGNVTTAEGVFEFGAEVADDRAGCDDFSEDVAGQIEGFDDLFRPRAGFRVEELGGGGVGFSTHCTPVSQ